MTGSTGTARSSGALERIGAIRPTSALFCIAVLFGILQAAPVVSDINRYVGNVYLPVTLLWLLLVITTGRPLSGQRNTHKALLVAASLAAIGMVGLMLHGFALEAFLNYCRVVLGPLALFVGLQWLDARELGLARSSVRWILFFAVALQVFYYFSAAGFNLLIPGFVFVHHSDISWWSVVGSHVLANPNNASVVFCAAFGWALAERTQGKPMLLSRLFAGTAALAIWVTGSRGAILIGIFLVVLAIGLRRRTRWLLWVAAIGLVLVQLWSFDIVTDLSFATKNLVEVVDLRWHARQAAVPVVLSHPFGAGNSVADALRQALSPVFTSEARGSTSHDLFLNWGVAMGYLGLILLIAALWIAVRRGHRTTDWLALLPLVGFLLAGESAGIDVLTYGNNAWAVLLWVLLGLAWRSGALAPAPRVLDPSDKPARSRRNDPYA